MRVFDPADREYEPAIRFFQECTRIKPSRHLRVAKWGFGIFIGAIVIALVWQAGRLS